MLDIFIEQDMVSDSLLQQFNLLEDYHNLNNFLPISKPVEGIITRGIIQNKKNPHYGIDIAAIFKSNVMACQKGLVILSDKIDYLGNTVIIAHPNNYYSLYAHMHKRLVSNREFVEKNQVNLLKELKKTRNNKKVIEKLNNIEKACLSDTNLVLPIIEAALEYASLGEIVDAMKKHFGEWFEKPII